MSTTIQKPKIVLKLGVKSKSNCKISTKLIIKLKNNPKEFLIEIFNLENIQIEKSAPIEAFKCKVDKLTCDFDGKVFYDKEKLEGHIKVCHQAAEKCEICGSMVNNLWYHNFYYHPREVNCFGNENSINDEKLTEKKFFSSPENSTTLIPTESSKNLNQSKYSNQSDISTALIKKGNQKLIFSCEICSKVFIYKSRLKIHMKRHEPKEFKCHHCDYKTDEKIDIKKHLKNHEEKNSSSSSSSESKVKTPRNNPKREKLECPHCDYLPISRKVLEKHLRTHDKNRLKDFHCNDCEYSTDIKRNLQRHVQKHLKNIQCHLCDFTSNFSRSLEVHIRNHEEGTVKYQCEDCSYSSNRLSNFAIHKRRHHGTKINENNKSIEEAVIITIDDD
ncbi:hypothetical protein PVAND_017439 [Polypedilum vanderplanki]|uniref:C2H2-type domain-containing protein n=1 Tax=Polypedilum vanderplanki TaxID=319348 RepID=A0A9J6BIP0_POLVA|nr:hypothetical protein PVAND_017439 [Polypedilum vanderplanki]